MFLYSYLTNHIPNCALHCQKACNMYYINLIQFITPTSTTTKLGEVLACYNSAVHNNCVLHKYRTAGCGSYIALQNIHRAYWCHSALCSLWLYFHKKEYFRHETANDVTVRKQNTSCCVPLTKSRGSYRDNSVNFLAFSVIYPETQFNAIVKLLQ